MRLMLIALLFLGLACSAPKDEKDSESGEAQSPEAISFSGKPLFLPPADPIALQKSDSVISSIK
ncbi:MAG: hypothetical protein RLN86_05090, partial [Cyclobacteriaceae bacterium]